MVVIERKYDFTVSIVMLTYNHESYIKQAIEGVLIQKTNFTIELIIGEDCSKDNTREICEEYAFKYPIIHLLPSQTNLGMMPNFIRSLNACNGKYIAVCDGDDYWTEPNKLQSQIDFLETNVDYSICFHNSKYLWENNSRNNLKMVSPFQKKTSYLENIIFDNFMPTNSVVFKNQPTIKYPSWFSTLKFGDWVLWILNAQYGKIGYINETMAVYRVHSTGAASSAIMDSQKMKENMTAMIQTYTLIDEYFNFSYKKLIEKRIAYYKKLAWRQGNQSILYIKLLGYIESLQNYNWLTRCIHFTNNMNKFIKGYINRLGVNR